MITLDFVDFCSEQKNKHGKRCISIAFDNWLFLSLSSA
jgi:hypothetical protein